MSPKTENTQRPHQIGLIALFTLDLFLIIVVVLAVVTTIGMVTVETGRASQEFWTNPWLLSALTLLLSGILSAVVVFMSYQIVFKPLRSMLSALRELARGNFDVQAERRRGIPVREIDDFVDAFNTTARELKSVEVLRTDFVDDFSHEFKTPIVSINGFAELLRDETITEDERREYTDIIARESKRLSSMAGDILALRQAESQERLTDAEEVNAGEQVRRAVILMQKKWSDKHLAFALDVDNATCTGNPELLERVWVNLIDNACKFSPVGGRVEISLHYEGKGLTFRATNDGVAISPAALERIFDRFYQADPSHATQGCGLGLPLVRRIAHLHGGTVTAESTPEGHTSFTLVFPVA